MPPANPELLTGLLASAMERALATYLALAESHRERLAPLAGRIIALRLRGSGLTVYLCPTEAAIPVLGGIDGTPDLTLSGTLWAFIRVGGRGDGETSLAALGIEVEGDVDTARRFRDFFAGIDIDWEAHLAAGLGKGVAASVLNGIRAGNAWARGVLESLQADLTEYWQEESKTLPTALETGEFITAVDILQGDTDRLETRILRLENRSRVAASPPKVPLGS